MRRSNPREVASLATTLLVLRALAATVASLRAARHAPLAKQSPHRRGDCFGDRLLRTTITRNVRLSEAPSYWLPILAYAPRSPGDLAYRPLAWELLNSNGLAPSAEVEHAV